MLLTFGALNQFGPDHAPQSPPAEAAPMPQSCFLVSMAQTAPLPSPCLHAVTSIQRESSGVFFQSPQPPQLPAGTISAQEVRIPSSVITQNRAGRCAERRGGE